ncbi:MAG: hypothetical protein ABFR47_02485 [Verrucomicrobiota bacterium]
MNKLDTKLCLYTILAMEIAVIIAYFGQPLIHGNDQAVNIIVTVYSILAGFLVAIIAIIGDPLLIPPGSWRIAEGNRPKTIQRLNRHKYLFYTYILSLAAIFASVLIKDKHPNMTKWLERIYLFLSVFAFEFSLCLPGALMRMQQERVDHIIESKRKNKGDRNHG